LAEDQVERDIDPEDDEGKAIDSCDLCDLDKGEVQVLRVAQDRPGKPGQEERPEIFQGDPEKWSQDDHPGPKADLDEAKEHGERSQVRLKYRISRSRMRMLNGKGIFP
jgi:hypothetical protein